MSAKILDSIPLIIQCGIDLLVSLIGALPDIIVALVQAMPTIISSIITALLEHIPDLINCGIDLLTSIITDLPNIIVTLVKAIPQIIKSLVSALGEGVSDFVDVGKNMLLGIGDGIANAVSSVVKKAKEAAQKVLNSVKSFFGIASPSRVFKDLIGKNLMLGLAEGIAAEGQAAIDAAVDVAEDIADVDFSTQTPDVPDPDNVDYAAIAANVRSSVQSAKSDTGTAVSAGSASEYYCGGADDSGTTDNDSTGGNPKYIQNDIHLDGKRVARVITPYVAEELEWEGK